MPTAAIYTIIKPDKPDAHLSGGFAVITTIREILEQIGLDVVIISPKDQWSDPDNFSISIFADIFNDPSGSQWFTIEQYTKFFNSSNFIVLENSYTGCTPEPYGLGGKVNNGGYPANDISSFMRELTQKAKMNIFVSPMHRFEFENFLKISIPNQYDFYQPINRSVFFNTNSYRDIPFLFVGALNNFKGLDVAIDLFGDKGLHIVGRGDINQYSLPPQTKYLGCMSPSELAAIYNRTKYFVHMPRWQEPFARTVIEAAACGCNLILNENVGAISFGYDIRDINLNLASVLDLKNRIGSLI